MSVDEFCCVFNEGLRISKWRDGRDGELSIAEASEENVIMHGVLSAAGSDKLATVRLLQVRETLVGYVQRT
jgi:hypothetical protein